MAISDNNREIGMLIADMRHLVNGAAEAKADRDAMGIMLGNMQAQLSDAKVQLHEAREDAAEMRKAVGIIQDEVSLLKPLREKMTRWAWIGAGVGMSISFMAAGVAFFFMAAKERILTFFFGG